MRFVFASVFAVFSNKKSAPAGELHCTKNAKLSILHRFFRCFPMCAAYISFILRCFLPTLDLSFSSVRGCRWWGGWEGGGGDDVHANAACVFCFFCCFLCVSHFASVFTVCLPTRLFAHASLDLHLSFSSVRGVGGGGGGGGGGG